MEICLVTYVIKILQEVVYYWQKLEQLISFKGDICHF